MPSWSEGRAQQLQGELLRRKVVLLKMRQAVSLDWL